MEARTTAIRLHGAYYLVTGLWPLLQLRSFEAVTGPKADRFMLRSASALFAVIGEDCPPRVVPVVVVPPGGFPGWVEIPGRPSGGNVAAPR